MVECDWAEPNSERRCHEQATWQIGCPAWEGKHMQSCDKHVVPLIQQTGLHLPFTMVAVPDVIVKTTRIKRCPVCQAPFVYCFVCNGTKQQTVGGGQVIPCTNCVDKSGVPQGGSYECQNVGVKH